MHKLVKVIHINYNILDEYGIECIRVFTANRINTKTTYIAPWMGRCCEAVSREGGLFSEYYLMTINS